MKPDGGEDLKDSQEEEATIEHKNRSWKGYINIYILITNNLFCPRLIEMRHESGDNTMRTERRLLYKFRSHPWMSTASRFPRR